MPSKFLVAKYSGRTFCIWTACITSSASNVMLCFFSYKPTLNQAEHLCGYEYAFLHRVWRYCQILEDGTVPASCTNVCPCPSVCPSVACWHQYADIILPWTFVCPSRKLLSGWRFLSAWEPYLDLVWIYTRRLDDDSLWWRSWDQMLSRRWV